LLRYFAIGKHDHTIRGRYGAEAVRDNDDGAPRESIAKRSLHERFGLCVEG
jgi:hypothetical protein